MLPLPLTLLLRVAGTDHPATSGRTSDACGTADSDAPCAESDVDAGAELLCEAYCLNGGDSAPNCHVNGTGMCTCPEGYRGVLCEIDELEVNRTYALAQGEAGAIKVSIAERFNVFAASLAVFLIVFFVFVAAVHRRRRVRRERRQRIACGLTMMGAAPSPAVRQPQGRAWQDGSTTASPNSPRVSSSGEPHPAKPVHPPGDGAALRDPSASPPDPLDYSVFSNPVVVPPPEEMPLPEPPNVVPLDRPADVNGTSDAACPTPPGPYVSPTSEASGDAFPFRVDSDAAAFTLDAEEDADAPADDSLVVCEDGMCTVLVCLAACVAVTRSGTPCFAVEVQTDAQEFAAWLLPRCPPLLAYDELLAMCSAADGVPRATSPAQSGTPAAPVAAAAEQRHSSGAAALEYSVAAPAVVGVGPGLAADDAVVVHAPSSDQLAARPTREDSGAQSIAAALNMDSMSFEMCTNGVDDPKSVESQAQASPEAQQIPPPPPPDPVLRPAAVGITVPSPPVTPGRSRGASIVSSGGGSREDDDAAADAPPPLVAPPSLTAPPVAEAPPPPVSLMLPPPLIQPARHRHTLGGGTHLHAAAAAAPL